MTVEDFLRSILRRWPVAFVGILLTLALCVVTLRAPGVYWAWSKVYFLVPATTKQPNQLAPDSSAAIAFAGLIQTEVNKGIPLRRATSPYVTLLDEGIYDGWSVLLPDTGGQWATNFEEASLIVQATGPSAEAVRSRMNDLINQITALVVAREDAAQVSLASRVDLTMSPPVVAVQYSNGHRSRAEAIIVLLGVGLSLAACIVIDRVAQTRRPRGEQANDGIGDARVRDAAGGDQDGAGREGAGAASGPASDRGGDRTASGDA
jgi:hypothetical protein